MSIFYNPNAIIKKGATKGRLKKAVSKSLTLKKSALKQVAKFTQGVNVSDLTDIALETIKNYRSRIDAVEDPIKRQKLKAELSRNPAQLINRVQSSVLFAISTRIATKYKGKKYRWLPSDAEEPDPEHQLNYGKVFTVGEGEMPGERYGCKCGMEILVDETELDLN